MNLISKIARIGGMVVAMSAISYNANALSLTVQQVGDAAIVVNDNGAGDNDSDAGSIVFTGSTTNFTFVLGLGQGDPVLTDPNGTAIGMNLTFNAVSDSTGGTINFTLSDENVDLANLIDAVSITSNIGGETAGIVTATTSIAVNDGPAIEIGNVVGNNGSFSGDFEGFLNNLNANDTFSFLTTVSIVQEKFGVSSGDVRIEAAVPVPAALPLFASALVGLGLLGRRRRG